MTTRAPQALAKLSRPRLHDPIARGHLFSTLDQLRAQGAIWVDGPPGAGKTSLIGSWLDARHCSSVWYQADAGDRDLATCISFLVQLGRQGRGSRRLPYLTADYVNDEATFTRRFLRELFARFGPDTVYVFDNGQEAASAAFHGLLKIAIGELPSSSCLIVISREAPNLEFGRELANRTLGRLGAEALRLTLPETRTIIERSNPSMLAHAERFHAQSNGWAAGLILLLAGSSTAGDGSLGIPHLPREELFAYFASELFLKAPAHEQDFLLRTALLRQIAPAVAFALTGRSDAEEILEALYRRNYFTDRSAAKDRGYRYHDLFREFLRHRARSAFTEEEWQRVRLHAANLSRDQGDLDTCMELLQEAHAWDEVRALVKTHAQSLIHQGRRSSVMRWIEALPAEHRDGDPWMLYWQGTARSLVDIPDGREVLGHAADLFRQYGDLEGEVRALSTYIDGYCREWNTVTAMDPWLDRLRALIVSSANAVSEAAGAAARISLLVALLYRRPGDPLLPRLAEEVHARLSAENDRDELLRAEVFLIFYYELMGNFAACAPLVHSARSKRDEALISPLLRIWEAFRTAHFHDMQGDSDAALIHQLDALTLEQQEGARISPAFCKVGRAHMLLSAGRPREAWPLLEEGRPLLSAKRQMEVVYFYWLELWALVLLGDMPRAHRLWDEFARMPTIGVPFNTAYNHAAIFILCERAQFATALERLERWRAGLVDMRSPLLDYNIDLMEAYVHVRANAAGEARRVLIRAFGTAARHGFYSSLSWIPEMMASLCGHALQMDIEREFVTGLIRRRQLRWTGADDRWPWSIKIYALGRFLVLKDDEPLRFGHRPQHRVLEVLRALIAAGAVGAPTQDLAAMIWPAHDGDAAHAALAVALHRLRKLLGTPEAVIVDAGWVRLNRDICWIDAPEFEDQCTRLLGLTDDEVDPGLWLRLVERYGGALFGGDLDTSRAIVTRDRLHIKFQRLVARLGDVLESKPDLPAAAGTYRRALASDCLNEELYRRLMSCLHRMGRTGEALEAYRSCRQILGTTMNLEPSAETEALASRLACTKR